MTRFGVPILTGPIEDQRLDAGSFDAIVMMDVLEHLPDPRQTIAACKRLLKPDGVFIAQTPCFPAKKSLHELHATEHQFPAMLDPHEHLFLFSAGAASRLMQESGLAWVRPLHAIFDFYDMSFAASRTPLLQSTPAQQDKSLQAGTAARMIQALLDLDSRRLTLLDKFRRLQTLARQRVA